MKYRLLQDLVRKSTSSRTVSIITCAYLAEMLVAGIGCRCRFVFLNRNNLRKAWKRSRKSRTRKWTEAHMIIVSPVVLLSASIILEEDDVKYSPSSIGGWGPVHTAYSLFLASCSSGHVKQRVAWKRCAQQEERRRRYDHIKAYSKTSVSVFLYYTFSKCFTDFQVVLHELQKKNFYFEITGRLKMARRALWCNTVK